MLMKGAASEQPAVAYKSGTRMLNPEHNKPVAYLKPTVVKGSSQNRCMDANTLAQIQSAKTEQLKQQEKDKVDRVDYLVRMNVSKLTEERSRLLNETRKIKEATVVRMNTAKEKYTITPQSKVRKEAAKEGPRKIQVQPTKVVWKKAVEVAGEEHRLGEDEQQPEVLGVQPVEPERRSVSPKPREKSREIKTKISIPAEREPEYDEESASQIDSDVNEREESMKDVLGKFEKLRCILKKR